MSKKTIKGYIVHVVWKDNPRDEGEFRFQQIPAYASDIYLQTDVCPFEIEFDLPEGFDPRAGQIECLKKQKDEIRAKYVAMVKEIDDRINSLLALEMS